jgi:protein-serine/threonine kinase
MLQRQMKYAISEVSILKQVDHPFIVKLYHSFQTARYLYMCLDHCACGDLS